MKASNDGFFSKDGIPDIKDIRSKNMITLEKSGPNKIGLEQKNLDVKSAGYF